MKTKAAILYDLNKPLKIQEIEIPRLKNGQVLVKILASGVCRTQINQWRGYYGADKFLPHLLGHEAAGVVVEQGPGISNFNKGDYVVASWIKGKGLDVSDSRYLYKDTIINSGAIATFTQYAVISENRLTKISNKVSPNVAVLLGCAYPTGAGIINHTLKVAKGTSIAVFGAGGVGGSAIMSAKSKGCGKIIAVDVSREKLNFAQKIGATHTINAAKENTKSRINEICNGGVDYAIEASGAKSAMESAFVCLSEKGTLVIAGNLKTGEKICLDPFDLISGKKIYGSWGGDTDPGKDIPAYANDHLAGKLDLGKLIGKIVPFSEINRAFGLLEKGLVNGRIIISM